MIDESQRAAFEEWARFSVPYLPLDRSESYEYADPRTEVAWYAWCAAVSQAGRIAETSRGIAESKLF